MPLDPLARTARIRSGARLDDDLEWLRATAVDAPPGWSVGAQLVCDCRCGCHLGPCGLPMDLDTMDCRFACRAAHILASECHLDETRRGAGAHV